MTMKVAVLGSGPAGLIAAHAAALHGAQIALFGSETPSKLFGAQYLHKPIPMIDCGTPTDVTYSLQGDIDGYRTKVYDDLDPDFVSPEQLTGTHQAWDIRKMYVELWRRWNEKINPFWLAKDGNDFWANYGEDFLDYFDVVVSTVPKPKMCMYPNNHEFISTNIWAAGDAPELGQWCPVQAAAEGQIICNGADTPSWYRVSKIHGHTTCEWPKKRQPPFDTVGSVVKPVRHTCSCFPGITYTGRYGAWQKGYLAHQAWDDTTLALRKAEQGRQMELFVDGTAG